MESVSFGSSATGYEAGPKSSPAVVVLQEWWGELHLLWLLGSHNAADMQQRCTAPVCWHTVTTQLHSLAPQAAP
jgi:hypothetical protein